MKLWSVAPLDKNQASEIQKKYELPAIIAMLLQIRKITTDEQIKDFLFNTTEILSPLEIKDMDKACARIRTAVESNEPICVFGDYDADGVTSTALMYSYLDTIGANAMFYIPSRENEGYGMNKNAVDLLNEKGIKLIITVDNGVSANEQIDYANSLGIDTVVTDHHMPPKSLPNACAVVDPHRTDCECGFKNYSGVGVAFMTIAALEGEYCDVNALLDNYSDLLCLGTIGDIVELKGANRVFVKRGVESIANTDRVGIASLLRQSGLFDKKINSGNVSFTLVPRINAVGRLGFADKCVLLLLTEDLQQADEISEQLCDDNVQRRQIENEILALIDEKIQKNPLSVMQKVIVVDGENWHMGVIGIVASRLKDVYGKPVIVISRDGETAKGSGRSVEGFSLCDAVLSCKDILIQCGGHPMAAGLSLKSEYISLFRKRINDYADKMESMPFDKLDIDCKLNPAYLSVELVDCLKYLEPFGAGNPTPTFGLYNMTIKKITSLSENKHLKLSLARDNTLIEAMKFFTSSNDFPYSKGDVVDLAVTLSTNEYNGKTNLTVIVKNMKSHKDDTAAMLESSRNYDDFCLGRKLTKQQLDNICPNRDDFALLYIYLKNNGGYNFPLETIVHKLDNKLTFGKIKVITQAMNELGLINIFDVIKSTKIELNKVDGRVSIESAKIIQKLRRCYDE